MPEGWRQARTVRMTVGQTLGLVWPYLRSRLLEQVRSLAPIVVYLAFFQILVLRIPIADALPISAGLAVTAVGLMLFLEGLILGLMPLGEVAGVRLPHRLRLAWLMVFAFLLGLGATFAEPAINGLRATGSTIRPWGAPLLFLLLNRYAWLLVLSVGVGVGAAVILGMLRFHYGFSLKRVLYPMVTLALVLTVLATRHPGLALITAVAWDCGAVVTGPVTVPLVVSLGVGIARAVGRSSSGMAGFGVVTLASLTPVVTILLLGLPLADKVPAPMSEQAFFEADNRAKAEFLFGSRDAMERYAFLHGSEASQLSLFDGERERMLSYLREVGRDADRRARVFGPAPDALERWALARGTPDQVRSVFGSTAAAQEAARRQTPNPVAEHPPLRLFGELLFGSMRAVLPLTFFLILLLRGYLRERLGRLDEIGLGLVFAIVGMACFDLGIHFGLGRLGSQVGSILPSAFRRIELVEQRTALPNFDPAVVQTALTAEGQMERFFFTRIDGRYQPVPYDPAARNPATGQYVLTPSKGPLFPAFGGGAGVAVLFAFAFFMGCAAALAEPALNALGVKVEELTAGAFRRRTLVRTVAVGVGVGMVFGLSKLLWNLPFIYLLLPPCILALVLTYYATDDFVNLGWDSAGVATGPITTPLVLSMGLGVGGQMGMVEGFGVLTMAAVWPILSVLTVGIVVDRRSRRALAEAASRSRDGRLA